MAIEYEGRILEINRDEFESKIEKLGAKYLGSYEQKRYVYDLIPKQESKWIRLRTNGKETTLAIKEVKNQEIDGTEELEIMVNDFEKTNLILGNLGYNFRAYQENRRIKYILDDCNIDIDKWPLIPEYVEIEGKSKESVLKLIKKLGYKEEELITMDVETLYKAKYGIDSHSFKKLNFDLEENKENF